MRDCGRSLVLVVEMVGDGVPLFVGPGACIEQCPFPFVVGLTWRSIERDEVILDFCVGCRHPRCRFPGGRTTLKRTQLIIRSGWSTPRARHQRRTALSARPQSPHTIDATRLYTQVHKCTMSSPSTGVPTCVCVWCVVCVSVLCVSVCVMRVFQRIIN